MTTRPESVIQRVCVCLCVCVCPCAHGRVTKRAMNGERGHAHLRSEARKKKLLHCSTAVVAAEHRINRTTQTTHPPAVALRKPTLLFARHTLFCLRFALNPLETMRWSRLGNAQTIVESPVKKGGAETAQRKTTLLESRNNRTRLNSVGRKPKPGQPESRNEVEFGRQKAETR